MIEYSATIGNKIYDKSDIKINQWDDKNKRYLRFKFEKRILVNGEIDVFISYKTIAYINDRVSIYIARNPCHGYQVNISYADSEMLSAYWLRSIDPMQKGFPKLKEIKSMSNSISAITNDWVLPGEGVCVWWM